MRMEQLKNGLLIGLIFTSLVLTQQVWFAEPMRMFASEGSLMEEKRESLEQARQMVLRPRQITAGFGGGPESSHYAILAPGDRDRFWIELLPLLEEHFLFDPEKETVSHEEYQRVLSGRCLEMTFAEGFPSALLSTLFDRQDNVIAGAVRQIDRLLIPGRYQGTVYLIDEEETVFAFTLAPHLLNHEVTPGELLDSVPVNSYVKYYALFSYVENDVLLPLNHQHNVPRLFVESEVDASSDSHMNQRAARFFNENFDFIKTIQETGGTRIYMYGYGQQEVRITNLGRLEYAAETGSQSSGSITRSLDTALLFLMENNGVTPGLVLREIQSITEGELRGHRFGFGYDLREVPVMLAREQHPVEIDVFGTSVKSYKTFVRRPMSLPEVLPDSGIQSPHRLIEENFNFLLTEMETRRGEEMEPFREEEASMGEEEREMQPVTGEELLSAIQDIRLVYLDREETHRRQLLIPVWRITIQTWMYDFDAHEGTLIQMTPLEKKDV